MSPGWFQFSDWILVCLAEQVWIVFRELGFSDGLLRESFRFLGCLSRILDLVFWRLFPSEDSIFSTLKSSVDGEAPRIISWQGGAMMVQDSGFS